MISSEFWILFWQSKRILLLNKTQSTTARILSPDPIKMIMSLSDSDTRMTQLNYYRLKMDFVAFQTCEQRSPSWPSWGCWCRWRGWSRHATGAPRQRLTPRSSSCITAPPRPSCSSPASWSPAMTSSAPPSPASMTASLEMCWTLTAGSCPPSQFHVRNSVKLRVISQLLWSL